MEIKKSPHADLKPKRFNFFLIGMSVTLLIILGAFNYTKKEEKLDDLEFFVPDEEMEIMENTVQEKKPPPPPPPPELEIVDDEVEIEEDQPEIEDTEVDQETVIEPIVEVEEEPEETGEVLQFFEVSKMAEFNGGQRAMMEFIAKNIEYPQRAQDNEVEGKVLVGFVVEPDGKLTNVQILSKELGWGLDEAAVAVVKKMSGMWTPAEQRDKKVRVRFQIPVRFKLY